MMRKALRIIVIIFLLIIVVETSIIFYFSKKIGNLKVLTSINDTLYVFSPLKLKEKTILITPEFSDRFSQFRSPFGDSLSFQELINKYVHNRFTDHYGAKRGTRKHRRMHEGIDLFVPINTPVYPLCGYGIVTNVSDDPHFLVKVQVKNQDGTIDSTKIEYGKTVQILYPEGISSIYTHLSNVNVTLGQEVGFHTIVGWTGKTGNVRNSGKPSHLHLELRDKNFNSFDPRHRLHYKQKSIKYFIKHLKL